MFEGLDTITEQEEVSDGSNVKQIAGSIDITEPENLSINKASIELTHEDTQNALHDPIEDRVSREDQLTGRQILSIIDRLEEEGVEHLVITGGEPTLRADFRSIIQYALRKIDTVVLQTNGTTDRNLSDYNDLVVSIPIEYMDPLNNNEVRRMTDPDKWAYNRKEMKLERKDITKSRLSGEVFPTKANAASSIARSHRKDAVEEFNRQTGLDVEDFDEMKDHPQFDWSILIEREEPRQLNKHEIALQLAVHKADSIDNPLIIRSNIYNNNNLLKIIAYGHLVEADIAFKPLYPVAKKKRLLEQVPAPKRMLNAMSMIRDLDNSIKQNVWMQSPFYKAWKFEADVHQGRETDVSADTYKEWWKRGRVSDIGIESIHISASGEVMPSKYVRHDKYRLGDITNKTLDEIKDNMADFNEMIISDKDHRPIQGFDLRQRCIAGDPNHYLNRAYPTHEDEVRTN